MIQFHHSLHGFRQGRGTSIASIEAKFRIQLATLHQRPLYDIFLDLHKAYDSLDRGRTIEILRGYGVGPRIIQVLRTFWTSQHSAVIQGVYHSGPFQVERGVTQGDMPSPTIFNIAMDAIV
jgi:hypothetical protein